MSRADAFTERAIHSALHHVSEERLVDLCRMLVDTPSYTGFEAALAVEIATSLIDIGIEADVQPLDSLQANAWGRVAADTHGHGPADGPTLLLYSPIDTATTGLPDHDLPWVGEAWRDDMEAHSHLHDSNVITGLGAMNPKGHAACVLMAAEAIARSGVPLRGDLLVAFGAGGMPTSTSRPEGPRPHQGTGAGAGDRDRDRDRGASFTAGTGGRRNLGHGAGCSFLLERGIWADAAIIAKSGWAVASAEVGLAWCEVTVRGAHTYVGARHRLPYDNPIVSAAQLVQLIEAWAPEYSDRHRSADGAITPQLVVGNFDAGWPDTAAFVPGAARFTVDLRLAPGQSPLDARRELEAFIAGELAAGTFDLSPDAVDVDLVAAIPGTATDPGHWVVRAATEAWEAVARRTHEVPLGTSGATDANILRSRGIPTARVGLPKLELDGGEVDFALGMNAVAVPAMIDLTKLLVRAAIATCSRSRSDLERSSRGSDHGRDDGRGGLDG